MSLLKLFFFVVSNVVHTLLFRNAIGPKSILLLSTQKLKYDIWTCVYHIFAFTEVILYVYVILLISIRDQNADKQKEISKKTFVNSPILSLTTQTNLGELTPPLNLTFQHINSVRYLKKFPIHFPRKSNTINVIFILIFTSITYRIIK